MIRKATKDDAAMIYQAHVSSIRKLCSGMYTPSQIHAWTKDLSPERYIQGMENFEFHVSESEDVKGQVSGFLIFNAELGEIYALYIAPWAIRKGLGRRLMDHAQSLIRKRGHHKMSLKSTLNAVSFYEHLGFKCMGESIHELPSGGTLPCMQMTKELA
jgi:ribosomal protein S18 acetylase RimI-like enzyme